MSAIGEFYLARLHELESGWRAQKRREDEGDDVPLFHFEQRLVDEMLADIAAKRKIVELHEQWPVLVERPPELVRTDPSDLDSWTFKMTQQIRWATEQEYRKVFGDDPPTSPIMRALVSVYADHPDFQEVWK
jgi:hypothetical protein